MVHRRGGASLPAVPPWAVVSRRLAPSRGAGVASICVLLQSLQLSQRDDVAALGAVPHRPLAGGVVVVEAGGVGVKQFPPLVVTGPLDAHSLRGVPHALPRQQVGVHALPCARLDDLHPLQPAGPNSIREDGVKIN